MPNVGFGMGQACLVPPEWVISWDKSVLIRQSHSWRQNVAAGTGELQIHGSCKSSHCVSMVVTHSLCSTPKTWYKPENVKNQCCTITTLICDLNPGILPPELFHYAAAFFCAFHMKSRGKSPSIYSFPCPPAHKNTQKQQEPEGS